MEGYRKWEEDTVEIPIDFEEYVLVACQILFGCNCLIYVLFVLNIRSLSITEKKSANFENEPGKRCFKLRYTVVDWVFIYTSCVSNVGVCAKIHGDFPEPDIVFKGRISI